MNTLLASDVTYQYPGTRRGIPPTSLSLQTGDFYHIKGASGSGKSTLARCLTGIIPHLYRGHLSGEVLLCGKNTKAHPLWLLAEETGMVFQNPAAQMLGNTIEEEVIFGLENLGLPKEEIKSRLDEMLATFQLDSFRKRAPQSLSGGEQQKLALAAIMARRPKVLVLDEPFSMLDITAATHLLQYLVSLAEQGTSIIAFEHRSEYFQGIPGITTLEINGQERDFPIPRPQQSPIQGISPVKSKPTLQVKDLTVRFSGRTILNQINFNLQGGQITAIVGRNGSGKTTLLRALSGLQPFDGTVSIDGTPPQLGLVYQNADLQLFNPTVRDEILFRISQPNLDYYHAILEILGLTQYEDTPPLLLSEGEKKRVALASVLMRQPQHGILMDEPSLGQDMRHKEMLIHLAKSLRDAGKIVVMTTHDLSLAAQADQIILLHPAGIIAQGPTKQVLLDAPTWEKAGLFVPEWIIQSEREIYA
ncbi:energy-coupling factor ABC transporter ATP-binding protein [bacterium]|nr:energy-coupling factor ABC transporter ATP-binding protein [bacterium]